MPAETPSVPRDRPVVGERLQPVIAKLLLRWPESWMTRLAETPAPIIDGQRLDRGVHLLRMLRARHRWRRWRRDGPWSAKSETWSSRVRPAPLAARLYRPADHALGARLLVYLHGGGFVIGDLDTHASLRAPPHIIERSGRGPRG